MKHFLTALVLALLGATPAAADFLYVASDMSGTVSWVSPGGDIVTPYASGFTNSQGIAFDAAGNLYVGNLSGASGNTVSRVTPAGVISTFASGLNGPRDLAFDAAANLYVSNVFGASVSRVTPAGVVSTFASFPMFSNPRGLAFDAAGNLYVATDPAGGSVNRITPGGTISTFVSGLGFQPNGLAFDAAGNLYVGSFGGITRVTPGGMASPFAGVPGTDLAFDAAGNLFASDVIGGVVNRVTPGGTASPFASISRPTGLAFGPDQVLPVTSIPEPATIVAFGAMAAGAYVLRRRKAVA